MGLQVSMELEEADEEEEDDKEMMKCTKIKMTQILSSSIK